MKKTLKPRETSTDFTDTWVIIKGQFNNRKGVDSFNPEDPTTHEWYQAMDRNTYHTVACGSNLDRVIRGLMNNVKGFKTQEAYYKFLGETTTEDYYRVHFLGMPPYSVREKEVMAKEGVSCAVSTPMKALYKEVVNTYGDYFYEEVEDAVARAYRELYASTRKTARGSVKKTKLVAKKTPKPTPTPQRGGAAKKTVLKPKKEPEYLILEEPATPKVTLKKNKIKLSLKHRRT